MTHYTARALEELCLEKGTWFFSSSYRKLSQGSHPHWSEECEVHGWWGKHSHLRTYCTGFIPQTVSRTAKTSIWFASHRSAPRTVPLKWQKSVDIELLQISRKWEWNAVTFERIQQSKATGKVRTWRRAGLVMPRLSKHIDSHVRE